MKCAESEGLFNRKKKDTKFDAFLDQLKKEASIEEVFGNLGQAFTNSKTI